MIMERKAKKTEEIEKNIINTIEWQDNISILDLSNRDISQFDENIKLPPNLVVLNISKNKFEDIPLCVLKLENLKTLDISYNNIVLFDDKPNFCHRLEYLNLNNNKLEMPPAWVWSEKLKKISHLDLSNNINIWRSCSDEYFDQLLQYTTLVNRIEFHGCKLSDNIKIMSTFKHAKIVILGNIGHNYISVNHIENVPCIGLEDCCDIEKLDLCNTHIYDVQHNIDIYQKLKELNLSHNKIHSLPNEFCHLNNLEICILSDNKILYLPDNIYKLLKLTELYLDNNELCMLPDKLNQIEGLKCLDLYNNHLYEGFENISYLERYDFAQNYGDEPQDNEYAIKKQNLRQNLFRFDGSVPEVCHIENDKIYEDEEDDERIVNENDDSKQSEVQEDDERCSSPEDWDSDSCWIPSVLDIDSKATPLNRNNTSTNSDSSIQWLNFVNKKIKEGNFCPMDMHLPISITDQVKYEKMYNPQPQFESDGQFDDCSEDDT